MKSSRLGGQLIGRHAEQTLGALGAKSNHSLRGIGDTAGTMWKQFVQVLEVELPETETERSERCSPDATADRCVLAGGVCAAIQLPKTASIPEIMKSVITNFVGCLSKIGTAPELCHAPGAGAHWL